MVSCLSSALEIPTNPSLILGITKTWTGACGLISRKARTCSSSQTTEDGIYFLTILSNIVSPDCISQDINNIREYYFPFKITQFFFHLLLLFASTFSCNTFNFRIIIIMIQQQSHLTDYHPYFTYYYPTLNHDQQIVNPVLNKVATDPISNSLYAAYSDGKVLRYDVKSSTLTNIFSIYDKTDVIDIEPMGSTLLTCSHNQITIFDTIKQKSMSLKGHEQTPISASAHPTSPLVVSVSNLVIQHDLRMKKPINVNFITPPVYNIKYFSDGSFYFLSGQPCRVGRNVWVRTLLNGIGQVSDNCKYIAVNEMNGNLVLWNWRKSTRQLVIPEVHNEQIYQSIYFKRENGEIRGLLFLQDDGMLLEHDLLSNKTYRKSILTEAQNENWKIHADENLNTQFIYVYEHERAEIRCFQASHLSIHHQ